MIEEQALGDIYPDLNGEIGPYACLDCVDGDDGGNNPPDGIFDEGEAVLEYGTGDDRNFSNELQEVILNTGFEFWYTENFVLRCGYIYDKEGDIKNPTFGAGIRFEGYGFDFGYTAGDKNHPRSNSLFFSVSAEL